ncbi:hypothetical protein N8550_02550, partial [Pirellulaceae bacterium]|nr:hypothetical protein [Pirellulaceae bacterium]
MKYPLVVAITGASGAPYSVRLLEVLLRNQVPVHLTISPSGAQVIAQELNRFVNLEDFDVTSLLGLNDSTAFDTSSLTYHNYKDYFTPIASGSFRTEGMVVAPCSGSTLSGIVASLTRHPSIRPMASIGCSRINHSVAINQYLRQFDCRSYNPFPPSVISLLKKR